MSAGAFEAPIPLSRAPDGQVRNLTESHKISTVSQTGCVQRCGVSVGCKTAWISDVCVCVGCVFLVQEPYNLSETVLYAGPFSFFS